MLLLLKRLRYSGSIVFVSALLLDKSLGYLLKIAVAKSMKLSPEIDFGRIVLSSIFVCSFILATGCVVLYYRKLKKCIVNRDGK